MRVLIAEDDAVTRRAIEAAAERLGHDVLAVADGQAAWELVQREPVDIVLSEWRLPRVDGPELCRRVRTAPDRPYVYFIFLAVLDGVDRVLAGLRVGADDCLSKPVDIEDLQVRLTAAERIAALHRHAWRREATRARRLALRDAIVRVARHLTAAGEPDLLLDRLVADVVATLDVDRASVYTCRDDGSALAPLARTALAPPGRTDQATEIDAATALPEVVRLAIERCETVAAPTESGPDDAPPDNGPDDAPADSSHGDTPAGSAPAQLAVPLVHEDTLLGALHVQRGAGRHSFDADDVETLELLAEVASAALVGLERGRLSGVRLAARTMQHELNNHLAIASGYAECLMANPALPPRAREQAALAVKAVMRASEVVARLQRVTCIQETDWGDLMPSTLDLKASTGASEDEVLP